MLDFEILKLLNSRMEYALRTKCFKASVEDLAREHEVIDYIQKHSQGLIEPEFCKNLFTDVISESKRLQCEDLKLIGFQGEHGAFGEVAARQFNRYLICISCAEFREVFDAVENGLLHYGVIPIESTLGGLVPDVNEFLTETILKIVGEVKIPDSLLPDDASRNRSSRDTGGLLASPGAFPLPGLPGTAQGGRPTLLRLRGRRAHADAGQA